MNRITELCLTAVMLLCMSIQLHAQKSQVSGVVSDNTGAPLVGVTVYESGNTSNGTVTGIDGKWSLTVQDGASVIFSCLGYQDITENVAGRKTIDVAMQDDSIALEAAEIVSVGYGTVAKRDLTGSVSSVGTDQIMKAPVTSFDQALSGKIAGVVVSTSDGAVGSEANIVIRGNNSLTQSSAPLYIIDGFPTESSMATSLGKADIESIDILKDASATAIYGARGANGVIVITTKQGVEGKPKVNFSASWTCNSIANKMDLMDAYDFVAMQTEICGINGSTNAYLKDGYTLEDYANAKTIDRQDQIYRTSLTHDYSISLSGGSKTAGNRYSISLSALDQNGIIVKSNFQRYQGKVNFQQKIGKKITIDLLANYSRSITNGTTPTSAQASSSASGWLIYSVWGYRPTVPLSQAALGDSWVNDMIDDGVASANDYRFNPAMTVRNEYRKTLVDYLNGNLAFNYEIVPGLKLKITGGYTSYMRRREEFNNTRTYTGYEQSPSGKGINGAIYWNDRRTWLNENTLTWSKNAKQHHLQLLAGFTMQGETYDYKGVKSEQMTTESLGLNGLHTGKYQNVVPWQYDWRMMSGLFKATYNYMYKYYATASLRADGSSKFPDGNKWGWFPSASLGWNFNREDLLKSSSWLNNGKLRASWGMTGNNRTTTPYDYYSQISTLPGDISSYDYVFNGQIVSGYFPSNMANEKLKWETTEQWNIGLDLGFFKDRIKFTADIYLKNTRDLLLQATIPASSGYTSAMLNIGSMRNKGLELTLNAVPVQKKNFRWDLNFNMAFNRNTVTALTNNQYSLMNTVSWDMRFNSQYAYITQVGKPTGLMYGYIYEGTYKADDFEGSLLKDGVAWLSSVGRAETRLGDPKYKDINGDGIVDDNDRTIIGRGQPICTGGFGSTFNFYGVDINFFFQWSAGNDILNANRLIFENGSLTNLNQLTSYKNRFNTETNPDSDIPAVCAQGMMVYSSRVIEDGSYLRLRNFSIGYTLPKRVLRKMKFDNFRIYVSADNVATFTKYSGPDPEVSTRSSVLTPGFDWSAYPRAFGVTGGMSFTF